MIYHDSTREEYRSPLGALHPGDALTLRLFTQDRPVTGVRVRLMGENMAELHNLYGANGWWQVALTLPQRTGVLWYCFEINMQGETWYYGCKSGETCGAGELTRYLPPSYQLTVYDASFTTPAFFRKGVMYQIFPDRFCKSEGAQPEKGVAYHRAMGRRATLHEKFSGVPDYLPQLGEQYYNPCDYFGGDIKGIEQMLPYLANLGVTVIYLNPIFEAASNHRYNTADYKKVDPVLGTNEDFEQLCRAAEEYGMRIVLDGVFSHTGSDSVYFNKQGNYSDIGAYQSERSPYFSWYTFRNFPDDYISWWGFDTLPEVNEHDAGWQEFVLHSEDSVMRHWLRHGAAGYRLDVADELPDDVIEQMRTVVKQEDGENLLLGEVWEDATTKQAYGRMRTYALGRGLDSVMNYPLRNAIVSFLTGRSSASVLKTTLLSQQQNYPAPMYYCLMNLLSSHDIERIRTALVLPACSENFTREQQAQFHVAADQDMFAGRLQRMAAAIVFSLPGMPSIYYGDETGMHGFKDPFNRAPFELLDRDLPHFYKTLIRFRGKNDALTMGYAAFIHMSDDVLGVFRCILDHRSALGEPARNGVVLTLVNRSSDCRHMVVDLYAVKDGLPAKQRSLLEKTEFMNGICLLTGRKLPIRRGLVEIELLPWSAEIIKCVLQH